jgi:hypothetical protein
MVAIPNGRRHSGPHRPGYQPKIRKGKRAIVVYITEAQFEAVTRRAQQEGTDKQHVGAALFTNYAKHGLTNG